jgi:hypothetical protein
MLFELRALRGVKGKVAVKRAGCMLHTKSVPCHRGMARPQATDTEDGPQIMGDSCSFVEIQSRTADKRWSYGPPGRLLRKGLSNLHRKR